MATVYRTSSTPTLTSARGLAIDTDLKRLLICDSTQITLTDLNLKQITTLTSWSGTAFDTVWGACYYDKRFYVCDSVNNALVRLNSADLTYKDSYTSLDTPKDVCTDGEYLYIADSGNNRIVKLNLKTLALVSTDNNINGALSDPSGIFYRKVGHENLLYISDTGNDRIIKCDTSFKYIAQNNTGVSSPLHLKVVNDMVHICDGSNEIVVLSSTGLSAQTTLTASGVTLSTPVGIESYKDSIFITDNVNDRITIWRAYQPRDALTPASNPVFGGKPFQNPHWTFGGSLIAGASSYNNWVDVMNNNFGLGWGEESIDTDSWSEETIDTHSWTEE